MGQSTCATGEILCDQGLSASPLVRWQRAEATLGIATHTPSPKRGSSDTTPLRNRTETAVGQPCVGSSWYAGQLQGDVFKQGGDGLWCYLESALTEVGGRRIIFLDTLIPPGAHLGATADEWGRAPGLHKPKKPARHARLPDGRTHAQARLRRQGPAQPTYLPASQGWGPCAP